VILALCHKDKKDNSYSETILTDDPPIETVFFVVDVDRRLIGLSRRRLCLGPDRETAAMQNEGRVQLIVTVDDRLDSSGYVERQTPLVCKTIENGQSLGKRSRDFLSELYLGFYNGGGSQRRIRNIPKGAEGVWGMEVPCRSRSENVWNYVQLLTFTCSKFRIYWMGVKLWQYFVQKRIQKKFRRFNGGSTPYTSPFWVRHLS